MKSFRLATLVAGFIASGASAQPLDWNHRDAVVEQAVRANASLTVLASQIDAARERVKPAGALPNPMLMGGVQNQQIDLSLDRMMTMYMVGASQTLTRRARRNALRTAAELDVERLEREYEAQRAEVERAVRMAWYDAAAAQNQLNATDEIARLAKTISEATRIRYETGAVPQADMIRAMLQESDIRHELLAIRGRRQQAVARLMALLKLTGPMELPPFILAAEMRRADQEQEAPATIPDSTPAIAALEVGVQRADEDIRLAKLANKPDWSVEASYGLRPYQKDVFNVVGRIELPFRKSTIIEPRIREAIARREAALGQIEALRQQLRQDLGVAAALRSEANEQIALHVDHLVPQARLGFESALVSYQNGKTTFDAVLSSAQTLRRLNVDYYDFLRQKREAEADIEAIRNGARSGAMRSSQ